MKSHGGLGMFQLTIILGLLAKLSLAVPIVGGKLVFSQVGSPNKYPFMISLQDVLENDDGGIRYRHFCGGSLITSRWILTAAHCTWLKKVDKIVAVIGHESIADSKYLDHYGIERAEYIYFQPMTYRNDIALLQLSVAYQSTLPPQLQFAQLPRFGMRADRNKACKIIGYGATKHAGVTQKHLNEGEVHVIKNRDCRRIMGHVWAPQKGENTVCALGKDQDTCQGDSGGALLCEYEGQSYVYGLVSHGLTCGISGIPSIYTVTIPYVDWIHFVLKKY